MAPHESIHPILSVVADDLAGAADTAAQVASVERPALVSLGPRPRWQPSSLLSEGKGASAWAIDADCRHVSERQCAQRIRAAFGQLGWLGPCSPYLKLDSTLRGNVGAALEAAQDGQGRQGVVLAPAFPERGRTVVDGVLLVDARPVAETEIAQDNAAPVTVSEVARIVRGQWECRSAVFDPRDFDSPEELAASLTQAIYDDFQLLAMDSQSPEDLQMIAAAIGHPKLQYEWPGVLPAGSAGLARGFAAVAGVGPPMPPPSPAAGCGVLAVIGSRTQAAAAQIEALERAGVECLAADAPDAIDRATGSMKRGAPAAITPGQAGHDSVATAAAEVVGRCGACALVMSGGATARRFWEMVGIQHMWIAGELQPGVAAGSAVTPDNESTPLVIKGGAAGNASAVLEAITWIRGA
jgi:uncharacterized protein YgbK (DUF1537 family)